MCLTFSSRLGAAFLTDASAIIDTVYHSKERLSNFQENELHSLKIGYMDPLTINLISKILKQLIQSNPNVIPTFTEDQTDANLSRLINNQLDLIIGMKDAKFNDSNIQFTLLHEEKMLCVMQKEHPLAKELIKHKKEEVTTNDIWKYRQIISVPPYLLRNFFSRGRYIIPVNDEMNNAI